MGNREDNIRRLTSELFDIVIIGGGATGSGISLDASLRGLKVGLVESGDFASGASSRSTKLIHGGVRYLETAIRHLDLKQFQLVIEGLKERAILLKIAPHLTHPLSMIIPMHTKFQTAYYFAGMKMYEILAGRRSIGATTFVSKNLVLEEFPYLDSQNLVGGIQLFDGQFDDARMNISIILSAQEEGAAVANYVEAEGFIKKDGRLIGLHVKDSLNGELLQIHAKVIVNATGALSDSVRCLDNPKAIPSVIGSIGSHILIDGSYTRSGRGLLLPKSGERVLFMLPWQGFSLVGTTDLPVAITKDPRPSEEEIDYLLESLEKEIGLKIEKTQIKASWAGIRPLILESKGKTSEISRGFKILTDPSGLYSIQGGKWTSYRKMGEVLLDSICKKENLRHKKCVTAETILCGGKGYSEKLSQVLAKQFRLDFDIADHLARSYGDRAQGLIRLSDVVEGGRQRLIEGYPYLSSEVIYAIRNEFAQTVLDVLCRRTRIAALDQEAALSVIPLVIKQMARELGWSDARQQEELVKSIAGIKIHPMHSTVSKVS